MSIYVSDFDLDAANVKTDSGGAAGGRPKIIEARESVKKKIRKRRRRGW
jgi:hypothetical protein